jgi:hypothetical protein
MIQGYPSKHSLELIPKKYTSCAVSVWVSMETLPASQLEAIKPNELLEAGYVV